MSKHKGTSVSVQKGPINPNPRTMQQLRPFEAALEDAYHDMKRRDGMHLNRMDSPKK